MEKFTIIAPTEYEGVIVDVLGKSGVVQLKEVSDIELEGINIRAKGIDFKELYEKTHSRLIFPYPKRRSSIGLARILLKKLSG